MSVFQTIKGFRDFTPEGCALRNYIFARWRRTARAYGFVEYEGPLLEPTDLYKKKSGDEITTQLFNFITKGEEDVSLRPEVTPTLARLAAANHRQYPKPLKWFQIGSCFRYEKPQRGRTREFIQFNIDILGEAGPSADAELIAFAIDSMRGFGLNAEDFVVRLSDRKLWTNFLQQQQLAEEHTPVFLQVIDKMERVPKEVTDAKLKEIGLSLQLVEEFISSVSEDSAEFAVLRENLQARGLWQYVKIDPGIVRGLAYYTGVVFEVFDLKHNLRAIAGGGRYDNLVGLLSNGVEMPACGFAMGDVVLTELINRNDVAKAASQSWIKENAGVDVYVILADEGQRPQALTLVQSLRDAGLRADYSFTNAKVGKQFQAAENAGARFAAVVGAEYPTLSVKNLQTRDQMEFTADTLAEKLLELLTVPVYGNLLA